MFLTAAGSGMGAPLVGRQEELRRIAELRDAGATGVVLVAGAGVGKSRLAREALAGAAAAGAQTGWVQATRSAATVPLGAFAGLLAAEVRSEDRLELLRRSAEMIRERSGADRLVLGVDDAQLLDPMSAALVLHLATTSAAFVLATVRAGEACPDAIVSLWKDAGSARLDLPSLGADATAQLVEAIVGGPVEGGAQHFIHDATRGNALYVHELVAGALADGALRQARGIWSLQHRPRVPGSLVELIGERQTGLSEAERRVLQLLALGEPLRVSELAGASGVASVADLEAQGWIVVDGSVPDGEVQLVHPLYGEAMAATLPVLRGRELRRQLAALLQARPDATPEDALRVARWLLDAGEAIPSGLLLRAARTANLSGDAGLGEALARRAVEDGAGLEAAIVLARSFVIRNRFEEAHEVLAPAERLITTQDEAMSYLEQQFEVLYWGLRSPSALRTLLDRAEAWWSDAGWRRRFEPMQLVMASFVAADGPGSTVAASEQLLHGPELAPAVRRQVESMHLRGLYWSGRAREAFAFARERLPSPPLRDIVDENVAAIWAGLSGESGERWDVMEGWWTAFLREAVGIGDTAGAGLAALALGHMRLLQGRFRDADRLLAEADLHHERHDPIGLGGVASALRAAVAYELGDPAAAQVAHERCSASDRGERPPLNQLPYRPCAEAWALAAAGDAHRAHRLLLERAGDFLATPIYGGRLAYEAMRLGAPASAVAAMLAELAGRGDSTLLHARAAHAVARAAGDGARLLDSADAFVAIGASRYASEAAAHAAEAYAAVGREDSARRAAARSRELVARDQGGTPPRIEGIDDDAVRLTPRERQLVELAARGLGNAEIAERLVLSVRTVESHMYRAMQKLGVNDRRQLVTRAPGD